MPRGRSLCLLLCMTCATTAVMADEPSHLHTQPAMTRTAARLRCAAAFVRTAAGCTVGAFGRLDAVADRVFFYGRYDIDPAAGNPIDRLPYHRIVIFQRSRHDILRPILISGNDAAVAYGTPRIFRSGRRILLHIPAREDGTGNFNRELLYAWENGRWRDVDVLSWLDQLKRRLPEGLAALKGIFPDYAAMKARSPIWHAASDSNACATAGYADLSLAWSADRIVLAGLRLHRSMKASNEEGCFE